MTMPDLTCAVCHLPASHSFQHHEGGLRGRVLCPTCYYGDNTGCGRIDDELPCPYCEGTLLPLVVPIGLYDLARG